MPAVVLVAVRKRNQSNNLCCILNPQIQCYNCHRRACVSHLAALKVYPLAVTDLVCMCYEECECPSTYCDECEYHLDVDPQPGERWHWPYLYPEIDIGSLPFRVWTLEDFLHDQ